VILDSEQVKSIEELSLHKIQDAKTAKELTYLYSAVKSNES